MGRYRVTVDTGGTFSDFVYFDEQSRELTITKVSSTPHDPSEAIMSGIQLLLDQGVQAEDISYFCHGTTVGTNALLEEKGVKTGLLVTEGFRGIYEVMEQARPYGSAIFNVMYDKPPMLVPQSRTGEVKGRIDFQGNVIAELDEQLLRETVRELAQQGVESMAVCLLFSFLHPEHEARVKSVIQEEIPNCSVSLSSEINPQIREYYRLSTTVINAYLHPILEKYISRLDRRLHEAGIATSQKYIMQSNGGTSTFRSTAEKAVTTVLSGPAGGVTAGVRLSETTGWKNLITFDMGGTSCDVALIKDGLPTLSRKGKINGRDISVPMMEINTVSAGGGTIARVDAMRVLEVGPDSAGAVPGPACYDRGGTQPTITDANLALGYLSENNFLGGRMALDKMKALQSIETHVAQKLGMDTIDAAEGIVEIVNVKMEEAIKAISTMRGYDLRDFTLVAFGGAGPLHAGRMAQDLDMAGVIVPLYPGVLSAIGLLMADVKHDYIQSKLSPLHSLRPEDVEEVFAKLEEQANNDLRSEGFDKESISIEYALDMRYSGQGYELTVPVSGGGLTADQLHSVRREFDATHKMMFGHSAPEEPVEIVSYRVTGIGKVPDVEMRKFTSMGGTLQDAYRETRPARFNGETVSCPVYDRGALDVGVSFSGPAIVEQLDTTLVVFPKQKAVVDEWKNIVITKEEANDAANG